MTDGKRTTREISFDQAPAELKLEVHRHIELYQLGNILSDAVICIQSDAEKAKKGLFGSAETSRTVAILTPRWLLRVVSGSKAPALALSTLLSDILIQDYANTPLAKMMPDTGIQVNRTFTDVTENSSVFIGHENNAAGRKFKEMASFAVQNAKK